MRFFAMVDSGPSSKLADAVCALSTLSLSSSDIVVIPEVRAGKLGSTSAVERYICVGQRTHQSIITSWSTGSGWEAWAACCTADISTELGFLKITGQLNLAAVFIRYLFSPYHVARERSFYPSAESSKQTLRHDVAIVR